VAGDASFGLTQGNLSLATFVPLNKKSFFSAGLQAGLAQRRLDQNKLIFPDQYNGSGYSQAVSSGNSLQQTSITYADMAGGFLWSYSEEERGLDAYTKVKAKVGFAAYHLNQPRQNFYSGFGRLPIRYVLHADANIKLAYSYTAIVPFFLIQLQGPSSEIVAGSLIKYYFNTSSKYTGIVKRNAFAYGLSYRSRDAVIVNLLMDWQETLCVILSYDVNISKLANASTARGGFEITLRYTKHKPFLYEKKDGRPKTQSPN
jgi:type IX secretion system PorP/SprF family membrane protein